VSNSASTLFGKFAAVRFCHHGSIKAMSEKQPRTILADNINRMIDRATTPGAKRSVRAWAISRGLDVKMIDRVTKDAHGISLDTLYTIAAAVGLEPWHLLIEDLDLDSPPAPKVSAKDLETLKTLRKLLG
jgi:hypothetical protein